MEDHLIIDWEKIHLYNSLMALVTGAAFYSLWSFFTALKNGNSYSPKGWALNFGVLGTILFLTGLHTTLTWPLSPTYPFDNTIFGEPCLVFGLLLLALAIYIWSQRHLITELSESDPEKFVKIFASDFKNFNPILFGIGCAVILLGIAGVRYGIFQAPPEEPIVGYLQQVIPYVTTYLVAFSWVMVGIAAIGVSRLFTAINKGSKQSFKWLITLLLIIGINFLTIGITTYYTHVGMIIHTMDPSTVKPNVIGKPHPEEYQNLEKSTE